MDFLVRYFLQGATLGFSAASTPGSLQTVLISEMLLGGFKRGARITLAPLITDAPIISSLQGFDPRGYRDRLYQAPACLNVLDFKDPVRARLMVFNDVSHYVDQPDRSSARLSKWWDVEKQ